MYTRYIFIGRGLFSEVKGYHLNEAYNSFSCFKQGR